MDPEQGGGQVPLLGPDTAASSPDSARVKEEELLADEH